MRLTTATRLKNLIVENISAVASPANARAFLVVKSTGEIVARAVRPDVQAAMRQHVLLGLRTHFGGRLQTINRLRYRSEAERATATQAVMEELIHALRRDTDVLDGVPDTETLATVQDFLGGLETESEAEMRSRKSDGETVNADDVRKLSDALADVIIGAVRKQQSASGETRPEPGTTPVDELQAEVTRRQNAGTELTRELIVVEILMSDTDLARRLKAFIQTQDGDHGKQLRAIVDRATASFGTDTSGNVITKGTAQAELDRLARARISKSGDALTYLDALDQVSQEDPALERAARHESTYASSGSTLAASPISKSGTGSAADEVTKRMQALVAKNDKLDPATAMQQVFAADPGLYRQWRNEHVSV